MADIKEEADEAQELGQGPPIPRVIPASRSSKIHSLTIYKYAIGPAKQAGDCNNITNCLILHIRKTYKNGRDIVNVIENQEPFNFNSSAPKLKMLTTVMTTATTPTES